MTFAEATARWQASRNMTADLGLGPVPVRDWSFSSSGGTGVAVFGPYDVPLQADGLTLAMDGAEDLRTFRSKLMLPAGATVRVSVTLGTAR